MQYYERYMGNEIKINGENAEVTIYYRYHFYTWYRIEGDWDITDTYENCPLDCFKAVDDRLAKLARLTECMIRDEYE